MKLNRFVHVFVFLLLFSSCLIATDKSGYNWFNPTPFSQMRPLNTDRPDQTESPYTVDAGHIQIETNFVSYLHDKSKGTTTSLTKIGDTGIKLGLTNQIDFQLFFDTYVHSKSSGDSVSGFGDVVTRLKINMGGNDAGDVAWGVMPFLKLPLRASDIRNGELEGGLIIPLSVSINERTGIGAMTEIDFVSVSENEYELQYLGTITASRSMSDRWSVFGELSLRLIPDDTCQTQFNSGVTFGLNPNLQLDMGFNKGVSGGAPDYVVFSGISWRH